MASKVKKTQKQRPFFTTFCNMVHDRVDGKPIEHNCFILDPESLALEAAGRFKDIEEIVKLPRTEMRHGKRAE